MSYDLAIGPTGDLVFAANRDLLGVSGYALLEQRIRTRLMVKRGSWVYDVNGTFGSRLHLVLNRTADQAASEITAYVYEALADMDDIAVSSVSIEPVEGNVRGDAIMVRVAYTPVINIDEVPINAPDEQLQEALITFELF